MDQIVSLDEQESIPEIVIEDMAGLAQISMKTEEFLSRFSFPNFYFHIAMAYAVARSNGVPLTKGAFDGLQ